MISRAISSEASSAQRSAVLNATTRIGLLNARTSDRKSRFRSEITLSRSVVPMDDRLWGVNQTSLLHCGSDANDRAPRGRELPVREGLTRKIVDCSGSWQAARPGNWLGGGPAAKGGVGGVG